MEIDHTNQAKPANLFRETVLLCALFGCLCLPLILSKQECNYSQDEASFHLPAVRQISAHWPLVDVANDSLSATAPGYHYFLATVSLVTGQNLVTLRLVNWSVSTLVLVVLYLHARRLLPRLDATLVLLPLVFSSFIVKSASWVVTDNAALLMVTLCLLSCLKRRAEGGRTWFESLICCTSVFVRQMTVWLVALTWAAAIASPSAERRRRLAQACAGSIPPLAVLAFLVFRWSGLVPPAWRDTATTVTLAGPVYLLSVFSLFAFSICLHNRPANPR
jgi:4-amino-4-deoxy-L-arabinose transferase-like glycosyltransferase